MLPTNSPEEPMQTRWAIASLALSMLLSSLGVSIPNVALPTLAQAFSMPYTAVQWVVIAYLLAITVTIVIVGRLGDMMGHRRVLLAGIFVFTLSSVLCGIAPNLPFLIFARGLQGLGAAVLMVLTVALSQGAIASNKTGTAMGLLSTMSAIGTALGPSLGGLLLGGIGWRAIFLAIVPLGILNFVLAYRALPKVERKAQLQKVSFDISGNVLLGLTLLTSALAVTTGGAFGRLNLLLLVCSVVLGILFVREESRAASPIIEPALFRDRALSAGLAMNVLVAIVMMATLVVGPLYLSRALSLSPTFVGFVMSIGPVISSLSGLPAGRLVDRFGTHAIALLGIIALATGCLALSRLPMYFGVAGYIAAIAVLTPGYQLFQAANNTAIVKNADSSERGVVSGILSLSRNLGLITGASVMGSIFTMASEGSNSATNTGMLVTFLVAFMFMVVAFGLAFLTTRPLPLKDAA